MRRLPASAGICLPAVGTLPLRRWERRLQGLPDALLRPGLSGEDSGRDALCRAADAVLSSRCGSPTSFSDSPAEPIRAIGIFQPPAAGFSRSFSRVFRFDTAVFLCCEPKSVRRVPSRRIRPPIQQSAITARKYFLTHPKSNAPENHPIKISFPIKSKCE